jgi:hypothetical protein
MDKMTLGARLVSVLVTPRITLDRRTGSSLTDKRRL